MHKIFSTLPDSDLITLMLTGGYITDNCTYDFNTDNSQFIHYEGIKYFCNICYPWLLSTNVVNIKYEDFVTNNIDTIYDSFKKQDIEVNMKKLEKVNSAINFSKVSGRKRGQEDQNSHFRKGIIGDYKNYFTELHKIICKKLIGEDLILLGYEKDYNW